MISPGEKFNAFTEHRLNNKNEGVTFEIGRRHIISPLKHYAFTFMHLLNRTVTIVPWVFWMKVFFQILQLAIIVFSPLNSDLWKTIPEGKSIADVLLIILRYSPMDLSKLGKYIKFAVICVVSYLLFGFCPLIMQFIKLKKEVTLYVKIYFFVGCCLLPIFQTCFSTTFAEVSTVFFMDMTLGNFFLSLFAFITLIIHIFNVAWIGFCMATGPHPNMNNPMAIWCPSALHPVQFDIFLNLNSALLEWTKDMKTLYFAIYLTVHLLLIMIPTLIYHVRITYFISFTAYELTISSLFGSVLYETALVVIAFIALPIPRWIILVLWILLFPICFIAIRVYVEARVHRGLIAIDSAGKGEEINDDDLISEPEHNISSFESIPIESPAKAIRYARVACIFSHPTFLDLSLVSYLINIFPEALFELLHLSFLIPDQSGYVTSLIDRFLDAKKPNFLEEAILFQIVTGIQESSNELSQTLLREISVQNLQGMKCQQYLSKVWTSCYKGDITQMSKHAFLLNKLIDTLNKRWKYLALRYPFSVPVLKDYVRFLSTIGCQHKRAEAIQNMNPKLVDNSLIGLDTEINISLLKQSIEESTDKRPIASTKKLLAALIVSVSLNVIILLVISGVSLYLLDIDRKHVEFVYCSGLIHMLMAQTPNLFDSLRLGVSIDRNEIYNITRTLSSSYNAYLKSLDDSQMKDQIDSMQKSHFELGTYHYDEQSSLINLVSKFVYYEHSLTYVPANPIDPIFKLVTENAVSAVHMIAESSKNRLHESDLDVNLIMTLSPILYVFIWVLIFIVMLPIVFSMINGLKDEMKYLFSLYLTIPRSMINKFIEVNGSAHRDNAKNALSAMMTNSFAHQTRTISDVEQPEEEKNQANLAENFKVLINDSPSNQSVLPHNFQVKILLVFVLTAGFPIVLSTITVAYMVDRIQEFKDCSWTIEIVAERTTASSLLLHGITAKKDNTNGYSQEDMEKQLNKMYELHSTLLFSSGNYSISKELFNSKEFQSLHFDTLCEENKPECKSMIILFDDYWNFAFNATINGLTTSEKEFTNMRYSYNRALYPRMKYLHECMLHCTNEKLGEARTAIILILVVGIVFLVIVSLMFIRPVIKNLDGTIASVKLPLKFIDPLDLAELTKLMQYLQGECDYGSTKIADTQQGSSGGASILNVMTCPFAIFENDFSLLFANNAFYNLLGTSREATIGLPIKEIFSPAFPFKEDEDHPFNSLLEHVQQLHRGVAAQKFVEIVTTMNSNGKQIPVMVRLVGICDGSQHAEGNGECEETNLKARQFVVFLTDLSSRKSIEEKLKKEAEVTSRLIDNAVPRALLNSMRVEDNLHPKMYERKPMVLFTLHTLKPDEEVDDDLIVSCSTLMRACSDINTTFSSVTKLVHQPPSWVYISGINQTNDDLKFAANELVHFAISVVEVFEETSSNQTVAISATIHIGNVTVIPLNLEMPTVEATGKGYRKLRKFGRTAHKGKTICTPEAYEIIQPMSDLTIKTLSDKVDGEAVHELSRVSDVPETENMF